MLSYWETVGKYDILINMEIQEDRVALMQGPHPAFPLGEEDEEGEERPVVSLGVLAPYAFLISTFF